jgi:transposase
MDLRSANLNEKGGESLLHQMSGLGQVKVEAAVGQSRPLLCLIRSVRLNEQVRMKREGVRNSENSRHALLSGPETGKMEEGYVKGPYKIAGIDVHKAMLAVVVTDAAKVGEFRFERRKFGAGAAQLKLLDDWLTGQGVKEVVMESTAQYWKPVWQALEGRYTLELAQAHSNKAPKGRKGDFIDAERLARRYVAGELILSFVPDEEQRLWRTLTRTKQQLTRDRVRLQAQLDSFLEEARIKLSNHMSDLLGLSGRRMLQALADGKTDAAEIATLADPGLRATQDELRDALNAAGTLKPLQRQILRLFLERLKLIEEQIDALEKGAAEALREHQEAVQRLAAVPGLGADSAQQIIAEVGPQAATFPSADQMASWVGCCPGREESAEVSKNNRSPKGNRQMRHILNQAANAAVKTKGSVFEVLYRRLVGRIGHFKAMWAVAHRLCRITWKILHDGVVYEERGQRTNPRAARHRANRLIRELKRLGYQVQANLITSGAAA